MARKFDENRTAMNSGFAKEWLALISGAWTAVEWKGLAFKGLQELSGPDLSETAAARAWLTDVPIYRLDWHVDKKAGSDRVFHMSSTRPVMSSAVIMQSYMRTPY